MFGGAWSLPLNKGAASFVRLGSPSDPGNMKGRRKELLRNGHTGAVLYRRRGCGLEAVVVQELGSSRSL